MKNFPVTLLTSHMDVLRVRPPGTLHPCNLQESINNMNTQLSKPEENSDAAMLDDAALENIVGGWGGGYQPQSYCYKPIPGTWNFKKTPRRYVKGTWRLKPCR